jgi:hypothetical protein
LAKIANTRHPVGATVLLSRSPFRILKQDWVIGAGMKSGLIGKTKRDDSSVILQDSLSLGIPFLDPLQL